MRAIFPASTFRRQAIARATVNVESTFWFEAPTCALHERVLAVQGGACVGAR